MKKIIVFGAGEFGSLISNLISYDNGFEISAYGDDSMNGNTLKDGIPVFDMNELIQFSKIKLIKRSVQ